MPFIETSFVLEVHIYVDVKKGKLMKEPPVSYDELNAPQAAFEVKVLQKYD